MGGPARIGVVLLGLAAGIVSPLAEQVFVASGGAELPAPAIEALDCESMFKILGEYADSSYRGIGPVPEGHPDRTIFEYEDRLAERHFQKCRAHAVYFEDPAPVFERGFQ